MTRPHGRHATGAELAGFVAVLDIAGQLAQDRVELLLGVFRRQVLGSGAGAVAGTPDDRAAGGSTAGVGHMRGAEALPGAHAAFVAPEGPVCALAALLGLDLGVWRLLREARS